MNEHRLLESLIPWYVNGTLDESEHDRLNRHLEDCPSCREQIRQEIEFSRLICQAPAALSQVGGAGARAELLATVAREQDSRPSRFHIRAIAAAGLLAITALFVGVFETKPAYRTLTAPASGNQPIVQILFEPSMSEQQIRDALAQFPGADLLDRPAAGLYRLAIDEPLHAERIAERARDLPGVRWADVER